MGKKIGNILICLGLALILGAGGMTWYNIRLEQKGAELSDAAVSAIHQLLPDAPTLGKIPQNVQLTPTPDFKVTDQGVEIPDYILNPKMKMPVETINGIDYIGYIQIPVLGIELPVIAETTDALLKMAPCRYKGTAYLDDLIIGGHNYRQHFASIGKLTPGDTVVFVDMKGNVFCYEVLGQELISANDAPGMVSGEWDLSLFTCNTSRSDRITIRCRKVK